MENRWKYPDLSHSWILRDFSCDGKKEHLDGTNFRHNYGKYFGSAILKVTWYQPCSKFYLNNYNAHWQRHLKDTLQLKILRTWNNIGTNSFLGKYHETKMGEGPRKTTSCTKTWPCSLNSISLIIALFFFAQSNLVFKFNLMLIEWNSHEFIYFFTFWYSAYLGVHPTPLCFFIITIKFPWG